MSVKIIKTTSGFTIPASDLKDGKAYEDEYGNIYIANSNFAWAAFGVCGSVILNKSATIKLREVQLVINVSNI